MTTCVECPVYKFDGKRYTCPLHPYADMNAEHRGMFSVVESCGGAAAYTATLNEERRRLYARLHRVRDCVQGLQQALIHACEADQESLLEEQLSLTKRSEDALLHLVRHIDSELKRINRGVL